MQYSRSISSALLALTLLTSSMPALARTNSSYYNNPVDYVKDRGLMTGYSNGSFGEYNTLNRAEFAKVITKIDRGNSYYDYNGSSLSFRDVARNAWYIPYVQYVYDRGYMTGYSSSSFGPDRSVTVAEAAKVLSSIYNLTLRSTDGDWYEQYIRALANRNAIPLSINGVNDPLTRGELADIIYRLDTDDRSRSSRSYADLIDENSISHHRSGNHCYQDTRGRTFCDNYSDYNYDTYYHDGNNCYLDRYNRQICNDNNNDCYYDSNNHYHCDSNTSDCYYDNYGNYQCSHTNDNCYYDSNNQYRCDNNNNNCYYDSNGRYRCDNNTNNNCYYDRYNNYVCNNYNDNNGDCVYDSDGNRVCGTSRNNNNDCYVDYYGNYQCNNSYNNNCYYDSNNRYVCH